MAWRVAAGGLAAVAGLVAGVPPANAQATALEPLAIASPGVLGRQGNRDASTYPRALSADGRWVVFTTAANNLDPLDRDAIEDVYVADTVGGAVQRISRSTPGEPSGIVLETAISPEGRWIAWHALAGAGSPAPSSLMLHDRASGQTRVVAAGPPQGSAFFGGIALADDARRVAFATAVPLSPADPDTRTDVYVWSRDDGQLRLVSRREDGGRLGVVPGSRLAFADGGRLLAFASRAEFDGPGTRNAVQVLDLDTGQRDEITAPAGGALVASNGAIDLGADGRWLAFATAAALLPEDANGELTDVYVFDRLQRRFELASVGNGGAAGDCSSSAPAISGDGARVVFASCARNFHPGANGVPEFYLRDRMAGTTEPLTRRLDGGLPSGHLSSSLFRGFSGAASIAADGSRAAFVSDAPGLVAGDTNRRFDVFVVDRVPRTTRRVGLAAGAALPAGASLGATNGLGEVRAFAARGGEQVVFNTEADNLLVPRTSGMLRFDTKRQALSDALPWLPAAPPTTVEVAQGISDAGSIVLVRRTEVPPEWFPLPPDPAVPHDLWLHGGGVGTHRVDDDPALGTRPHTHAATLSGDGLRVAFATSPSEPPRPPGVFVYDVATQQTRRIDVLPGGAAPAVGASGPLGLSRNGRWLAFASAADGLVPGDADGSNDLFLADLLDASLLRLRHPQAGTPLLEQDAILRVGAAVSDDGQRLAFDAMRADLLPGAPLARHAFLLDRAAGRLLHLSAGRPGLPEGGSAPTLSADGRRVAFLQGELVRVLELAADGTVVSEPTAAFPAVPAAHAAISPDGYAVAVASRAAFDWLPRWLGSELAVPYLLRLPEAALFADGMEAAPRSR